MDRAVQEWIDEMARLTQPDRVVWIDGSEAQRQQLTAEALSTGEITELNQDKLPGCVLHRTAQNDVARVEHLTFICTSKRDDAGPTNNWMAPADAYQKLGTIFAGSMRGRTMYVIPYIMGVPGSPFSKVGIELTDSIYVVLNMLIMTRSGDVALAQLGDSTDFVKGLHGKAERDPERRFICHFPEDNTIWSVGSGYGGNVLLGKKCFALRIASYMGWQEGWMAEHMLIVGIEDPSGRTTYVAAAFPSACGKTNLAMMIPPEVFRGYKVWTVGDDIAWMRIGPDGQLWALNPEAGFFGVAPGTSYKTNPNAMETVKRDTIFTNVLLTPDRTVWWEGMDEDPPDEGIDWRGNRWQPGTGDPGANPNARFTAPARNCPSISPEWENPGGVPISAIVFGGRRMRAVPLVYQAFNWQHGVFVGAVMGSETTTAATGKVGVLRRDPMAMLPFCGYNMGDYFAHWLEMGRRIPRPPQIFNVNWFRTDASGNFIWPGFGENFRVIKWIVERSVGDAPARETPIGYVPTETALDLTGLKISPDTMRVLLDVDADAWKGEVEDQQRFFAGFDRMPSELIEEQQALMNRLERSSIRG